MEPIQGALALDPPALPVKPYAGHVPSVKGSDTSEEAARSQEPNVGTKQLTILEEFRSHSEGLTDDELEGLTGWRHQTVSARRRELVLGGLVRDTGERRLTSSNRSATVWAAT